MRQIAIYGKGGIGKSTVTQNVAAALAERNNKMLLLGCDPKADSARLILGGFSPTPVMEVVIDTLDQVVPEQIVQTGFLGIDAVESGGPEPGSGCAGKGISLALQIMEEVGVYNNGYDYVLYDVLGDVVCGGFSAPIRTGKAREIYIVCSGEFMALYAANNICKGICNIASDGEVRLGGLICNSRNTGKEAEIVSEFAEMIGTKMIACLPRDNIMQMAELNKQTVIEYAPDHEMADCYRELAKSIDENTAFVIPRPLSNEELERMFEKYLRSMQ